MNTMNIKIKDMKFDPEVVIVKKGTFITWTNDDKVSHVLTNDSVTPFNTGLIEPGKTSEPIQFDNVGHFEYHCSMHKKMHGIVQVKKTVI